MGPPAGTVPEAKVTPLVSVAVQETGEGPCSPAAARCRASGEQHVAVVVGHGVELAIALSTAVA